MRLSTISTVLVFACLFTATTTHALVTSYGPRQIAEAGEGCVGGLTSAHGTVAYYRGDTLMLNRHLSLLADSGMQFQSLKVVLHAGELKVDSSEETPQTGLSDQSQQQISVDWSIKKACSFDELITGRCEHDEQTVTVHVWVANEIRLNDLIVPDGFAVQSAGEIDEFVERHAGGQ